MARSVLSEPHFHNEDAAFAYVEKKLWPNGPHCPHCGATGEHVRKLNGKTTRKGLHKCYACRKPFTVRIGTIFEGSHLPLHLWLQVIHLMCASKKGISTRQIQRMLKCSMKTAWFLSHRIREAMKETDPSPMGGKGRVVEADETFTGPREFKFTNKDGWRSKGRAYKVVSLVERGGKVRSVHVASLSSNRVRDILVKNADINSVLSTDEAVYYKRVGKEFKRHWTVNHSKGQYGHGMAHTNTIEGYFSIFKRGMRGVYQHCSENHLQRYLTEFDFRYSNREGLDVDDESRAEIALKGFRGKRLTYETTHSQAVS